jgi:hypothetical protein
MVPGVQEGDSMNGWIGVDLDGTMAYYDHGSFDARKIGAPIARMIERIKEWLSQGIEVRVFTARVSDGDLTTIMMIEEWTREHIGRTLEVTCKKDYRMIELWDDRAVQVIPNTGERADGK